MSLAWPQAYISSISQTSVSSVLILKLSYSDFGQSKDPSQEMSSLLDPRVCPSGLLYAVTLCTEQTLGVPFTFVVLAWPGLEIMMALQVDGEACLGGGDISSSFLQSCLEAPALPAPSLTQEFQCSTYQSLTQA